MLDYRSVEFMKKAPPAQLLGIRYISFWIKITSEPHWHQLRDGHPWGGGFNTTFLGLKKLMRKKTNSGAFEILEILVMIHHFERMLGEKNEGCLIFFGIWWATWGLWRWKASTSDLQWSLSGCHPDPEITCWWCQRRVASRMIGT